MCTAVFFVVEMGRTQFEKERDEMVELTEMPNRITIPVPDNWHCHLREGPLLSFMVKHLIESGFRGRVLAMPNLAEAVLNADSASRYKQVIDLAHLSYNFDDPEGFEQVMTIQITEATTPEIIEQASRCGVRVAKVYPRDVTTNSANGVVNYEKIYPVLTQAEVCGMVVCFHPEHPSHDAQGLSKEGKFIDILRKIEERFKRLKMVIEHISSSQMAYWVSAAPPNVAATITPQHLLLTIDDVIGYSERSGYKGCVHNMCKPTLKFREDMNLLQMCAVSGESRFFYGGDDAAHLRINKEAARCACGVFNTTVALPVLAQIFEERKALDKLANFTSGFGADFYGFPRNTETITLEKSSWQVPSEYPVQDTFNESVVPMLAGETLNWKLVS
jgi:dihydroorotase